jgi:hypothetical protein
VGQVEGRFSSLGDSVNLGEIGAWFAPNYHRHAINFGRTRWYSWLHGKMEARFNLFGDSVNLDAR